jgi:hypothetical protein
MNRFTKIGKDGAKLDDGANEWVAVLDNTTGLIWDAGETEELNFAAAQSHANGSEVAGFKDWRLPTVEELFMLADRTKFEPAIDKGFFPNCHNDWYWTGTVVAKYPADCAWLVDFDDGGADWGAQNDGYRVRAVRASQ